MSLPRRLTCAAAAAIALVACDRSPTTPDPNTQPDGPSLATNTSLVCMSTSVPTGYVILSYGYSISCPYSGAYGTYPNAKTIGLPETPETVCYGSPIPDGWVVTSYPGRQVACDRYGTGTTSTTDNLMTIEIPGDSETVCSGSPIPSDYEIVSSSWISACDRYNSGYSTWPNSSRIRRQ